MKKIVIFSFFDNKIFKKKSKLILLRHPLIYFFFQLLILGNKISDINSKIPSFIPTKDTCFV